MRSNITQQLQKDSIRKQVLEKRKNFTQNFVLAKSAKVYKNFLTISGILEKSNYCLYLPINNEVETDKIIKTLEYNGKNIYLPAFFNNSWVLAKYTNKKNLETGPFGILQPTEKIIIDPYVIDFAIFPGVAFDIFGNRLGYGSGVYDKLFYETKAIKVGLAYEEQIIKKVPNDYQDLKMHFIVTEERIINCMLFND